MFVLALSVELHIPHAGSLKGKRSIVKSIVEGGRQRYGVASSEVAFHDQWQRARLGFAAVSGTQRHAQDVIDEVERFVWSHPEVEVLSSERAWMEMEP